MKARLKRTLILAVLAATMAVLGLSESAQAAIYNPHTYLASPQFDGGNPGDSEKFFPIQGSGGRLINQYAPYCAWNGNSAIDVEDVSETCVPYQITSVAYGQTYEGGTISSAHPSNQRPAVYWRQRDLSSAVCPHCGTYHTGWTVYEYWYYYAVNDAYDPFDHEQDWEKYYLYFYNNLPTEVRLSCHSNFNNIAWVVLESGALIENGSHPKLSIEGSTDYFTGSHAFEYITYYTELQDGVRIKYDGYVNPRNGYLAAYSHLSWLIFSNDPRASGVTPYTLTPTSYCKDDPQIGGSNDYDDPMPAPWNRVDWNNPPGPYCPWTL